MRLRRKPNLAPRMERRSHLLIAEPKELYGKWRDEFGYDEIYIELGCGKGRFTAETARENPDVLIVALEKLADAMVIALERVDEMQLANVRFINYFADYLDDYFAQGEASRIYINFCDPWPSNRHIKRRLTSRGFLDIYKKVLPPGGEIHFKTDNVPLFDYSLHEFETCGFTLSEVTRDLHGTGPAGVMTDYEMKFHGMGIPICRCVARYARVLSFEC